MISSRGRSGLGRWALMPLVAVFAAVGPLLVVPATASACPSYAKVKAFHGFGSARFKGTVSGDDHQGGTATVELDEGAAGIEYPSVTPQRGTHHHAFIGRADKSAGSVGVDDSYTDINGEQTTKGSQTALGDIVSGGVGIGIAPLGKCAYQLRFSFAIKTKSSGQWPKPTSQGGPGPDRGVSVYAASPVRPLPANHRLSGTAKVPVYCEDYVGAGGSFTFQGFYPGNDSWGGEFCTLSGVSGKQSVGKATVSWHFTPKKQQHK